MTYTNFSANLSKLKAELKLIVDYTKAYKKDRKILILVEGNYNYYKTSTENRDAFKKEHPDWKPDFKCDYGIKHHFRHMHIAYCLLRGRTMKQIESKVREGNEPNKDLINAYVMKFMGIKNFIENITTFRRDKPVVKMYVLVREDLDPIHRTVQGGHAVAQYLLEHKDDLEKTSNDGIKQRWNNGYMIYLGVKDEYELNNFEAKLEAAGKSFSTFVETDWGEPTKTAIACVDFGEIFSELKLLSVKVKEEEAEVV